MLSEQDRADIFRQCLKELEQGHSTVEQCAARYPDWLELHDMLMVTQTARRIAPPAMSVARKQELREQLVGRMRARKPILALPQPSQTKQWARWVALVPACLLVFFISGATLLYGAESALPNDALYGLKRASEHVGVALARPQSRAYVLAQLAQTRLTELVILMERGQSVDAAFFNDVTHSLNAALAANPDIAIRTALYNQADLVLQIMNVRNVNPDYIDSLTTVTVAIATPTPTHTSTLQPTMPSATPTMTYTPLITSTFTPSATLTPSPTLLSRATATKTSAGAIRITPFIAPTSTPFVTYTPIAVITSEPTVTPPSNELRQQIVACVNDEGPRNSLLVKLNSNQLRSFINEVAAQSGKKINATCATQLIQLATALLTDPTPTPNSASANSSGHGPNDRNCPDKGNAADRC